MICRVDGLSGKALFLSQHQGLESFSSSPHPTPNEVLHNPRISISQSVYTHQLPCTVGDQERPRGHARLLADLTSLSLNSAMNRNPNLHPHALSVAQTLSPGNQQAEPLNHKSVMDGGNEGKPAEVTVYQETLRSRPWLLAWVGVP